MQCFRAALKGGNTLVENPITAIDGAELINRLSDSARNYTRQYRELMSYYRCALKEVETKLNVLDEES